MKERLIGFFDKGILYSFYAIFFLVPLAMYPSTFELFEFNKMWTVFIFTILIGFFWISKIITTGKITLKRTPLDIPILLFLASQIISTIISLDRNVSIWGYYSRFNGGLLSIISYIFLYYAFVNNLTHTEGKPKFSLRLLTVSLISGAIVALWGFPSHFGYDPTCLVFRGSFDVSCWTDAFQPKIRMFSTLGQPNWLSAYLGILIPIALAFIFLRFKPNTTISILNKKSNFWGLSKLSVGFILLSILFYIDAIFAWSQSGFIGIAIALIFFLLAFTLINLKDKNFSLNSFLKDKVFKIILSVNIVFLILTFFLGIPINQINKFSFQGIKTTLSTKSQTFKSQANTDTKPPEIGGGTDSGQIRLIVWRGALEIFKKNPIFGTGVETFAYAYYKERPKEHNLVSEWDYLYNKAHNEYLNYLSTTGILGLGSYLLIIITFLFTALKSLISKSKNRISNTEYQILAIALVASFISIVVSNFFGFSVVILNLYLFIIPIIFYDVIGKTGGFNEKVFVLLKTKIETKKKFQTNNLSRIQKVSIALIALFALFFEYKLLLFWIADKNYAHGYNLDKIGEYSQAYESLQQAVRLRPNEDLFKDEQAINLATLSYILTVQNQSSQAAALSQQAKLIHDQVIEKHPNNVVYFKTRTRLFYTLSQVDKNYIQYALDAITKASQLAPTDAKISYNMALLYGEAGQKEKAIEILKNTIYLKPGYRDAYYAIALYYSQLAKDEKDFTKSEEYNKNAIEKLNYILQNISDKDTAAKTLLDSIN